MRRDQLLLGQTRPGADADRKEVNRGVGEYWQRPRAKIGGLIWKTGKGPGELQVAGCR